jgi:hypothetical protein
VLLSIQVWRLTPTKAGSTCAFGSLLRETTCTVSGRFAHHLLISAAREPSFRPIWRTIANDCLCEVCQLRCPLMNTAWYLRWPGPFGRAAGTIERESLECISTGSSNWRATRPRTLNHRPHSRSIDQATKTGEASRFVMATGAGGAPALSTKSSRSCSKQGTGQWVHAWVHQIAATGLVNQGELPAVASLSTQ